MHRRYIIKRKLSDPPEALAKVRALPGIHVVDDVDEMALLVEASKAALEANARYLADFTVAPERKYALPRKLTPRPGT